jgi:hypothetical protein
MARDIRSLSPTDLVRLLNSTPLGTVTSAPKVGRQMDRAGLRITATGSDGKRINLVKYVAWLAREYDQGDAAPLTYEERKKREAERNQAKTKAGRDIGAIPQVENPARRARCESDLQAFCEMYFPAALRRAVRLRHAPGFG